MKFKSFEIINTFIRDIYNVDFLATPMEEKISQISELARAHLTVNEIIEEGRQPFSTELMENVFPILEVALQWEELRKSKKITEAFLEKCRKRMGPPSSNFRGTIFEIDIATRCLLSNCSVDFPEDYTKEGKQIDLLIEKPRVEKIGLECESKRGTEVLHAGKLNENIEIKSKKFQPEFLELLGIHLDKRIVIIDITRKRYATPSMIQDLSQIEVPKNLDSVILTWRDDVREGENHSLQIKYRALGNIPDKYFLTTWSSEFHVGPVFFLRKYMEPEPSHGKWGPEETHNDTHGK